MLLMFDNYDSFIYNFVQYLQMLGVEVKVVCNDVLSVDEIVVFVFECIVILFGLCMFNEVGVLLELICWLGLIMLIFGVCLGYQSIGQVYGGDVICVGIIMYGKILLIWYEGKGVFVGLLDCYQVMCYYLLVVDKIILLVCLEVIVWIENEDGMVEEIMGLWYCEYLVEGVQFYFEFIFIEYGYVLLKNFLQC